MDIYYVLLMTFQLPKGCDKMFIQKLYQGYEGKGSAHFSKPRTSTSAFAIHHYAGSVEYEGCGFVEKNVDSVIEEHITLLRASKVGAGLCSRPDGCQN